MSTSFEVSGNGKVNFVVFARICGNKDKFCHVNILYRKYKGRKYFTWL
jgi:hypothetical protein